MDIGTYVRQLAHLKQRFAIRDGHDLDYLCPICHQYFDVRSEELSIEHVPQRSLGGRKEVITCKKCNNGAGWKVEPHLKNAIALFANRNFPKERDITVDVDIGESKKLRGVLTRNDSQQARLFLSEKNNDKRLIDKWNSKIDFGIRSFSVQPTSHKKILDNRLLVALLKAAYLQIFWRFGYVPLYHSYFDPIRAQINNPEGLVYPLDICYLTDDDLYMGNTGVNMLRLRDYKFIVSSFKLTFEEVTKQFNIMVPLMYTKHGIGTDALMLYHFLRKNSVNQLVDGNNISNIERPVLNQDVENISDYLATLLF